MRKKPLLAATLAFTLLGAGAAPAFAEGTPVLVRAAAHAAFDRVVFDWPRDVKFEMHRDGDRATITFDAGGDVKFSKDAADLTRAKGFRAHDENGHVIVSFMLAPGAALKTFTSGTSVVLDITGKEAPNAAPPQPAPATPAPQSLLPPAKADAENKTPASPAPVIAPAKAADKPAPMPAPAPVPAKAAEKPAPTPAPAVPAPTPAPAKPADKPVAVKAAPAAPAPAPKAAEISDQVIGDTPVLVATLDPHIATRAVIFQRADVGYIVFERKLTTTAAALENGVPAKINLQPVDMAKNSGFRFAVPQNSELYATRDGTVWKIYLSKRQSDMPVTTALVAQPEFALGARLLLPLPDAPEPIRFTDPVVGDELILVPLAQSEAFNANRHMPDLEILPAAQGLVIRPLSDKIVVRAVSDGIEITAEGGLMLSQGSDTGASQQSATKAKAAAAGKSMFDFATWGGKPDETFTKTRQRLQQIIVDVPEAERNRARLELARFYFANGNGEEALALLDALAEQVPDLRAHADFMGLVGAAEILAYRNDEGLHDLAMPMLADQPEVELWQAVALAQSRDWIHAEEKFAARESLLTGYPEPFFSRFFVLAIESALAADKNHEAADWLDFVSAAPHNKEIDPALNYLRGALHAKAGRATAAQESWKKVTSSNDRLYKVRAELALIDLGVSTASLTPAQAADRLEALRFGWRGDDLEVDILHRLGQFYIEAKNPKAGLNSMTQAITLYPSSPLVPQIHLEMTNIFHDVFMGDLGKGLSPLDSLTLYQQYRDLMPGGKDGDGIMQNLAERLVDVDLLDQASGILEDLAKNRLQGAEKDHAVLRLAGIRLLDHKPTEAMAAIDMIGNDTLSPAMQNERVLLHARALSEMHRDSDALVLLKENDSPDARMLRADINMHGQNWQAAATALLELVGPPPAKGTVLTDEQGAWMVNAAIAYAMDDDQTGLDRLAIDYGDAMAGTSQNDTFRMLTQPQKTGQLRDLAAAQAQITQVDMFQKFLNAYRKAPGADAAKK